jgi:hypothetical protein
VGKEGDNPSSWDLKIRKSVSSEALVLCRA